MCLWMRGAYREPKNHADEDAYISSEKHNFDPNLNIITIV